MKHVHQGQCRGCGCSSHSGGRCDLPLYCNCPRHRFVECREKHEAQPVLSPFVRRALANELPGKAVTVR